MSKCDIHNINIKYTCPVCEYRSNFIGLESIYLESFDTGYNGYGYSVIYVKQAYEKGKAMRKLYE